MKKFFLVVAVAAHIAACAQHIDAVINAKQVARIENVLASDSMQGRKAGTPGIRKAADFIAGEFKKAGLQPLKGDSYLQEFTMQAPQVISISGEIDGVKMEPKNIIAVTNEADLNINENSGYTIKYIKAGDNIGQSLQDIRKASQNTLVVLDPELANVFPRLKSLQRPSFQSSDATAKNANMVFVLGAYQPKAFSINVKQRIDQPPFANVVGMLTGKSKKNEYVIFSAHYDHLGIGKPVEGDSIYNGANDDAAGTTAVIMLANYFKQLGNNERTLIFAAFTAEEMGGFGSQYFSKQLNPDQVVAMFNIEMIGTESKWGKASAYITGYEKSDMGKILQKNLQIEVL